MVATGQEKVREKTIFSRWGKGQGIFNLIRENGNFEKSQGKVTMVRENWDLWAWHLWKSYTQLFPYSNSLKNIVLYNWITIFQEIWIGIHFKCNGTFWLWSYAVAHLSKSLRILHLGRETKPYAGSLTNFFKERQ